MFVNTALELLHLILEYSFIKALELFSKGRNQQQQVPPTCFLSQKMECLKWPPPELIHYSSSNTEPLQGLLNVTGVVNCQSRVTPKYSLGAFKGTNIHSNTSKLGIIFIYIYIIKSNTE